LPQYSKTAWVDGSAPAISAANLNKLEQGVFDAIRQDGSTTMSAQLVTIAGSAATPAIAPTGDSNTGIFFPAADTIAFGEGGTEAMRITSAGNVGIGHTAESQIIGQLTTHKLSSTPAQTAIAIAGALATGSSGHAILWKQHATYTTGFITCDAVNAGAGTGLIFGTANAYGSADASEKMRIMNNGNVGIGTASPTVKLEIGGDTINTNNAFFTSGASDAGFKLGFANGSGSTANSEHAVLSFAYSGTRIGGIGFNRGGTANCGAITFFTNTNNERMRIDVNGNVGIGTTSPTSQLHVYNNGGAASSMVETNTTGGDAKIALKTNGTGGRHWYWQTGDNASTLNGRLRLWDSTAGAERLNIDSNGYLLIGYTTSNGAYPLQVNGQIFATSSTIATSDGRYKKDIVSLDGALDIVAALNPVQFNWKDHPVHKFNTEVPTIGFIAQEVAEVLKDKAYLTSVIKKSECTWETETGEVIEREVTRDVETQVEREVIEEVDGEEIARTITETVIEQVTEIVNEPVKEVHTEEFYGIAESNMIAILTKAIQELKAEVDALKAQLAK
jgi:hypothetical protein